MTVYIVVPYRYNFLSDLSWGENNSFPLVLMVCTQVLGGGAGAAAGTVRDADGMCRVRKVPFL